MAVSKVPSKDTARKKTICMVNSGLWCYSFRVVYRLQTPAIQDATVQLMGRWKIMVSVRHECIATMLLWSLRIQENAKMVKNAVYLTR